MYDFDFVLYTRDICEKCNNLKDELSRLNFPYVEKQIDVDVSRERVLAMNPPTMALPLIYNRAMGRWMDEDFICTLALVIHKTKANLASGKHEIRFTKADGTERVMKATRDPSLIPESKSPKTRKKEKAGIISVFDLDKGEWRSFNVLRFLDGKVLDD